MGQTKQYVTLKARYIELARPTFLSMLEPDSRRPVPTNRLHTKIRINSDPMILCFFLTTLLVSSRRILVNGKGLGRSGHSSTAVWRSTGGKTEANQITRIKTYSIVTLPTINVTYWHGIEPGPPRKKKHKTLSQDSQYSDSGLNRKPPEYKKSFTATMNDPVYIISLAMVV